VWHAAAERLGAAMGPSPYHGLVSKRGTIAIHARVIEEIGVRSRQTQVWARARVRPQPRIAIGTRRRRLQHVALDVGVVAWTEQPRRLATRWTSDDTGRWHVLAPARLVGDGQTINCTIDGVVDSVDRLCAAVELVGRLADDDLGAAAALAGLPGATPLPGLLAVRLSPDDVVVEIDEHASATVIRGGAPATITARLRSRAEIERAEWATPETATAFAASGAAAIDVRLGESRLTWASLELDPVKLRAGIAVIRAIAGGGDAGPYR
jgi:hypothetical protein